MPTSDYLARIAQRKLQHEAKRSEHRLGRLVCHANMLDALVLGVSEAQTEQNEYFDELFQKTKASQPTVKELQIIYEDEER